MNIFELFATIRLNDDGFTRGINDAKNQTEGFASGIKGLISTVAGLTVVSKAFDAITGSIEGAIERYDTLNRFPRVLELMGYGATNAADATTKLRDGILGLPTSLNDIVASTQKLVSITGDLELSTDTTLALNNALIASGASTSDARRGMIQYVQQLSKGSVDMVSWRTLQETMGYALRETAEAMGFTGRAATSELYDALQSGNITFDQFNDKLIELSNATGGFAEMAKEASGGIGTSWTNMQIAITRGVASIIRAIDENLTKNSLPNLQQSIELVGVGFEKFLNTVATVTGNIIRTVAPAIHTLSENLDILIPLLTGVVAGFVALSIVKSINALLLTTTKSIQAYNASMQLMSLITERDTAVTVLSAFAKDKSTTSEAARIAMKKAGMTVDAQGTLITAAGTAATEAEALAIIKSSGAISAKSVIVGLLTGQMTLATAGTWLWNAALTALPFVGIVAGIGALVAVITTVINKTNEATQKYKEQSKEVATLIETYNDNKKAIEDTMNAEITKADSVVLLRDKLFELDKQIRSNTLSEEESIQKRNELKVVSEELTKAIPDLVIQFDNETGALLDQENQIYRTTEAYIQMAKQKALSTAFSENIQTSTQQIAELQKKLDDLGEAPEKFGKAMKVSSVYAGGADIMVQPITEAYRQWEITNDKINTELQQALKDQEYWLQQAGELEKTRVEERAEVNVDGNQKIIEQNTKAFDEEEKLLKRSLDRQKITELEYYSSLAQVRDKYLDRGSEEYEEVNTEIIKFSNKRIEENRKAQEKLAEDQQKQAEKSAKEQERIEKEKFDSYKKWIENRKFFGLLSAEEEIAEWQRVADKYVDGSDEKLEVEKKIFTLRNELEKEGFNKSKKWIETRKKFGLISLGEEIELWEKVQSRYLEGTEEREKADEALFNARKKLAEEQEKISDKIQKAEEKYTKAFEDRTKAIFNAFGLFEQLTKKEDKRKDALEKATKAYKSAEKAVSDLQDKLMKTEDSEEAVELFEELTEKQNELTKASKERAAAEKEASKSAGQVLLENLKSQVDAMTSWAANLETLSAKGIDEGLLAELRAMGPGAADEIEALSKMTEKELTDYSNLWAEKQRIAKEQATKELAPLKEETDDLIKSLADEKLAMETGETIGKTIAQSLGDALIDAQSGLYQKALSVANTIQSAFGVEATTSTVPTLSSLIGSALTAGLAGLTGTSAQTSTTTATVNQYVYGVQSSQTAFEMYRLTQKAAEVAFT